MEKENKKFLHFFLTFLFIWLMRKFHLETFLLEFSFPVLSPFKNCVDFFKYKASGLILRLETLLCESERIATRGSTAFSTFYTSPASEPKQCATQGWDGNYAHPISRIVAEQMIQLYLPQYLVPQIYCTCVNGIVPFEIVQNCSSDCMKLIEPTWFLF